MKYTRRIINKRLEELGIQQKELAENIGVSESALTRYMNEERQLKAEVIKKICKELNISSDELLNIQQED